MKGLRMIAGALVVGCVVAGCTPGDEPAVTPSPVPPTTALPPTPTPTPTPQWNEEEQGAADAVQRYLEKWTYLAQNLGADGLDLGQIREVATDPIANADQDAFLAWYRKGWHLVGSPSFRVDAVERGAMAPTSTTLRVKGCYTVGSDLVDVAGNVATGHREIPGVVTYTVIHFNSEYYFVSDSRAEDLAC